MLRGVGRVILWVAAAFALLCGCVGGEDPLRYHRVVFVGASSTADWDFDYYFPGYDFHKVIVYNVDKTAGWDRIRALEPDVVVVKENAAYFYAAGGTPLSEYHRIMERMVALIERAGMVPVLATTLPVDIGYGGCTQAQLIDIRSFNSWVSYCCNTHGIECLDLYSVIAGNDDELPREFHDGDGLHLNRRGYDELYPVVLPALRRALGR